MSFSYTPDMDLNPDAPVKLGAAIRVPSYAYEDWGIPVGKHRRESDEAYSIEWLGGGPNQMDNVILALKTAGMGNYSQILRDANTAFVKAYMKHHKGLVNYLELGFGESTVQMFDALDENDKDRINITGVEPSEKRANGSAEKLVKLGMVLGDNLNVYHGVDNDILEKGYARPGSQNLVTAVATFHHHAYLKRPTKVIYVVLANGGIFVSDDWHNSMWEHPNRVYRFLESRPHWEGKEDDLASYMEMFPRARETALIMSRVDEAANADIRKFWVGWMEAREQAINKGEFEPNDDIWMHEGHRPVGKYAEVMMDVGFALKTHDIDKICKEADFSGNPCFHLEGNSLLATIAGQKPI